MGNGSWSSVELGEVIDLFDSKRVPLSGKQRAERQGPYPYYGASGIIDYIDDYIFDGQYLLIAEDGENLNSRKLPVAFWGNGKFWVNNHAHIVLGKKGIADTDFIRHYLLQANISGYITGAAQPKLSQGNLRRIQILLPEYEEQVRISSILSSYDNLIENNNRRIEILEEMAQSLYREWFVKFRFPGYDQAADKPVDSVTDCPEPPNTKDGASQCRMVDSPLGPIPEGWEIHSASQVIQINPKMKLDKKGEKPFLGMSGLSETSMIITDVVNKEGNSGAKYQNGDTLFSRITPCLQNGKIGYVQFLNNEQPIGFGSTEFIVLRETEHCSREFVYLLSRSDNFRNNAINSMSGATGRQRVHNACFDTYQLAVPPKELMGKFTAAVRPMFKSCFNLSCRNENLKKQRDLLLPKLISGQIALGHAEQATA